MSAPSSAPTFTRTGRRNHWRKVELAREEIEKSSRKVAKALIKKAMDGDAQTARWLLSHTAVMSEMGEELRPIASGIDRPSQAASPGDNAPRILIGVSLGSDFARLNAQPSDRHALPAVVVSHAVPDSE